VPQGEQAYRYCLKALILTGQEDFEQVTQKFNHIVAITQWSPRVALIQLWLALTKKAKPYGLGPNVAEIFAAL